MREIKFRGETFGSKKLYFGSHVRIDYKHYIVNPDAGMARCECGEQGFAGFVEVIPESVVQFVTKDKHGKDVFAGDKVDYGSHRAIVKRNDGDFGYHLEFIDLPAMEPIQTERKVTNILYREMCKDIELIGEKELLAVLDMSEDEQWEWCVKNVKEKTIGESLADLAFRLRNEVCGEVNGCEKYNAGLEAIYEYRGIKKQCQSFYAFLEYRIGPIDIIIAALIAKEKEDV